MSQSLVQIYIHLVFSTKDRRPFLQDKELREATHAYLAGIFKNLDSPALIIGGVEDHVHVSFRLGKQRKISDIVREVKRDSSTWVKEQYPVLSNFYWQSGYCAFSVSPTHLNSLAEYIQNQESRHEQVTFQEEFRRLCEKNGIEIDERYVWD